MFPVRTRSIPRPGEGRRRFRSSATALAFGILLGSLAFLGHGLPAAAQGYQVGLTPSGDPYVIPGGGGYGYQQPYAPGSAQSYGQPQSWAAESLGQPAPPAPAGYAPGAWPTPPQPQPMNVQPPPPAAAPAQPANWESGVPPSILELEAAQDRVNFTPPPQPVPVAATAAEPAGPRYKEGIYAIQGDYWASYPENAWRMLTGPARYDEGDWLNVAAVVGGTATLVLADEALRDLWQNDIKNDTTDSVFTDGLEPLGEFYPWIYASIAGYAVSELLDARREKAAALMTLETLVLTGLVTNGLKYVSGRNRPDDSDDRFDFNGPGGGESKWNGAFPSGHSSTAFAVASVMSEVYGPTNPWVPYVAYPLAAGTALSRVNDNDHWFSDVFLGGAIGLFIGKMVTRYNPFLVEEGLTLQPFASPEGQGFAMNVDF